MTDYDDLCKRLPGLELACNQYLHSDYGELVRNVGQAIAALREQVAAQSNAADMIAEERDAWEASAKKGRVWWLPWPPQEVARRFHLAYEQFAPDFGYETRPDTKVFDPNSANGQLMIAVVRNVLIEQASNHLGDLEKAEADNAALLRDAFRYRWLRDAENGVASVEFMQGDGNWSFTCEDSLDAAIDAAMLAGKKP